jgi:hypothetical protein
MWYDILVNGEKLKMLRINHQATSVGQGEGGAGAGEVKGIILEFSAASF